MKTYPAIYLNNENNQERLNGVLYFDDNNLCFTSDQRIASIPKARLTIDAGNGRSRFIFFRDTKKPGICIYTEDHAIFNEDWIRGNEAVMQLRRNSRRQRQMALGCLGFVILFLLLALMALFSFRNKLVQTIANKIPTEWEIEIGTQLFNSIKAQHTLLSDDSLTATVTRQIQPLLLRVDEPAYPFHVFISRDTIMNAFALPGGNIVINSGLIQQAGSWEELLGVLSHEIAHITLKHHTRGIIQQAGLRTLLSLWFGSGNDVASMIGNMGGELASLSYSREFEQEADDEGFTMLEKAGIDPRGMTVFFERILEEEKKNAQPGIRDYSIFSTHPPTRERINRMRDKAKPGTIKGKPLANWKAFQLAVIEQCHKIDKMP